MVFAAFFVLACPFDSDGDFAVASSSAADPASAAEELSRALPAEGVQRPLTAPSPRVRLGAASLLTAVPGGLCLLI